MPRTLELRDDGLAVSFRGLVQLGTFRRRLVVPWSAVVLDSAAVPPERFTPMFACARVAGWSAHILEQKREARLIRPTANYVGAGPREVAATTT